MGIDDLCNTGLVLGLGLASETYNTSKKPSHHHQNQPSLTLSLFGDHHHHQPLAVKGFDSDVKHNKNKQSGNNFNDQISSGDVISAASSLSNASVKREREVVTSEEVEIERVINSSRASDEDDDGSNGSKKLRLNKAQSALLEDSFKHHSTLNPKQKQDLARTLNLRPRQVEVWFQNRRARTKLKQTEVDCEYLKKYCETLTEENRRLQKEVQELRALKLSQPLCMQLPAATLTMCPSCERIGGGGAAVSDGGAAKSPFAMGAAKAHFYQPFTNPSAAF